MENLGNEVTVKVKVSFVRKHDLTNFKIFIHICIYQNIHCYIFNESVIY